MSSGVARIGPNAITRAAEALRAQLGEAAARHVFDHAGLLRYLAAPPEAMVDEADVTALHRALRADLDAGAARRVAWEAGVRTGDYLLAHRIPAPVQFLLRHLPAAPATRLLLRAVARHAWTFCGSGSFSARLGSPATVSIAGCPLCRDAKAEAPVCDYYAATFQRLFCQLVNRRTRVVETACEAMGAAACVFEIHWRGPPSA